MKTRTTTAKWLDQYQRWQIKVTNEDGVRKTFTSSIPGRKGQTECHAKADEWLRDGIKDPEVRCCDLIAMWISDLKKRTQVFNLDGELTQNAHFDKTESIARVWISPKIGLKKIGKLRRIDLQEILDDAFLSGRSKKTIENIRGTLSLFLKWCRARDLTRLTTDDLEIPKNAKVGERSILQPSHLQTLFSVDESSWRFKPVPAWYIHAWRFSVVVGLRPGELFALEKRHLFGDRLQVQGSLNYRGIKTAGKNNNARRTIALTQIAKEILQDQKDMLCRAGIVSNYIFPAPDGSPANQGTASRHWDRYCEHNGIPKVTPYELRHTYVSVVSGRSDLSIGELRSTVGHSQNMDTLGVYSHGLTGSESRIADQIDSAYRNLLHKN